MKKIIRKWLDIDQEISSLQRDNKALYTLARKQKETLRFLQKEFKIGLDIHHENKGRDRSWAVVCLRGRPEQIRFIDLENGYEVEISRFLMNFEHSQKIIDSPFQLGRRVLKF